MLNRTEPARCKGKFNPDYLSNPDWVAEPKLDGGRYMLYIELDGDVHLYSRRDFPRIDKAANVPHFARFYPGLAGTILDGEVIIEKAVSEGFRPVPLGETTGVMNSSPEKALKRQTEPGCRLFYCVFDILAANGQDVRHLPLSDRRTLLLEVVRHMRQYTDTVILIGQYDDKEGFFREQLEAGLEGIVLKNKNTAYGMNWVKMKRCADFSVVISGYKPGQGKYSDTLGAVAVSVYNDTATGLVEVGFASGMTDAEREDIWENQQAYLGRVIDITAQEVTKDGRLRHPRWLRFRDDVNPTTCTMGKLLSDAKNARRG